jgi:hypothetical protein
MQGVPITTRWVGSATRQRSRTHIEISGRIVSRTSDEIVAATFSLSGSTPHLFGKQCDAFEADLRRLLHDASPAGVFSEQMRDIAADIWRP